MVYMYHRFFKKLGIKPPSDPAIPLLGIYLEETKIEKDTLYPIFHCSTIYNSWNMEAAWMPISRRMDKEAVAQLLS